MSTPEATPAPAPASGPAPGRATAAPWWNAFVPFLVGLVAVLVITFPFIWLRFELQPSGEVYARWDVKGGVDFWQNMGPVCLIGLGIGLLAHAYNAWGLQRYTDQVWLPVKPWTQSLYAPLVAYAVIVAYGFSGHMGFALAPSPTTLNLGIQVGIYMILAMGLNIVIGYTGLLVLGYAGFIAIGAYTFAILQKPDFIPGLPWWAGIPIVFIVGGAVGWLIGLPCIRLRGDYLAIVTLGFAEGVRELAINLEVTGQTSGILLRNASKIGLAPDKPTILAWVLLLVIICAAAIYRIYHSPLGRAWIAIREDEVAAGAMGIPVVRMKLLSFALSSAFAGVGGLLIAAYTGFVSPDVANFNNSVTVLAMVILGGLGSLPGVLLGAGILYLLPELLRGYVDFEYRLMIFGALMIIMMIYRPQGLLGTSRHAIELKGG
ncbi:hypothetical protein DB346_10775 [Verrucomicrobia bacterium LW23]|nr:hypothetical protein DB346_10775 [Verrucomicrobia bacterium LW23]